jgi:hypothetical protein
VQEAHLASFGLVDMLVLAIGGAAGGMGVLPFRSRLRDHPRLLEILLPIGVIAGGSVALALAGSLPPGNAAMLFVLTALAVVAVLAVPWRRRTGR